MMIGIIFCVWMITVILLALIILLIINKQRVSLANQDEIIKAQREIINQLKKQVGMLKEHAGFSQ